MHHLALPAAAIVLAAPLIAAPPAAASDAAAPMLVELMADELDYSMRHLVNDDGKRPYFLAYTITDVASASISGQLGAIYQENTGRQRVLDVDVRVGDYELDSTRTSCAARGPADSGGAAFGGGRPRSASRIIAGRDQAHPVAGDGSRASRTAVERYQQVARQPEDDGRGGDGRPTTSPARSTSLHYEDDVRDRVWTTTRGAADHPQTSPRWRSVLSR